MTRPLRSLYYLVLLDLSFLLLFLKSVFNKEPLEDLLRALLDIKFHSLLISSYLSVTARIVGIVKTS
jgi:hypothetical protein